MNQNEEHKNERYRKFLKQRFLLEGLEREEEILELLLIYGMPRRDIRPIAQSLLEEYGCFKQVLNAPFPELVAFPGMDVHSSILLKAARDLPKLYLEHISRIMPTEEGI
jgi:DNA repair protein RadC